MNEWVEHRMEPDKKKGRQVLHNYLAAYDENKKREREKNPEKKT